MLAIWVTLVTVAVSNQMTEVASAATAQSSTLMSLSPPPDDPSDSTPAISDAPKGCPEDPFEPNDSRHQARPLTSPPRMACVCPGDVDWYRVRLPADTEIEIVAAGQWEKAAPECSVYPPRARKPVGTQHRDGDKLGVRFRTRKEGIYRLRVEGRDSVCRDYHVEVAIDGR